MRTRPRAAVVGAGRLARAVVPGLVKVGYGPVLVLTRAALEDPLPADVGLVLLAVPDDSIAEAARALARSTARWRGRVVLHAAGALSPVPLRALARRGASTGVAHPLQVLGADARTARALLRGSLWRVEGDARARRLAARLARDLGGTPLDVSRRALYHAAASLASNDVVALLDLAGAALVRAGVPPARARVGVLRLAEGALAQARAAGLDAALTGPVARGDARTLARQLAALRGSPLALAAHAALSRHLLVLTTQRGGGLTGARRRAVARALGLTV